MPRALLSFIGCAAAILIIFLSTSARADWVQGEYTYNGKPVGEFHCVPANKPPFPAVIILHGSGPRIRAHNPMEDMCEELASAGYYAEYIEYYSQTDDVTPGQRAKMREYFPVWMGEIRAGIDALDSDRRIDPRRIGMMGFSLGAFLSLATGATDPGKIAAIVEYYGGLPAALEPMAANLPPTLILHGDADQLVPVAQARELDKLLTETGRPHEIHIYPGANHAFNFHIPVWYNASDAQDAWARTLAFFARYLGGAAASKVQASAH